MTAGEKLAAWLIGAGVAVTRVLALSKTPWDSDEGLFMSALRHYDVVVHHPHPPGFPLFIALAKPFTFFGEFHALQLLSLVASVAIVPATIFLGRAVGISVRVSLIAACFLAFFPNVWFFGGTAFSDVPSMTLSMVAIALLLRGELTLAAIVTGVAAGIRPQTLLIVAVPALIAFSKNGWRRALTFVAIAGVIVIAGYGAAAHVSGGWAQYRQSLVDHEQYIATHDSFRAPLRPPMWNLFDDFFLRPYYAPLINVLISLLGAISVVRRRRPIVLLILTFAPFCLAAWALLDRFSTSRFSIGYAPMIAFIAADGLEILARRAAPIGAAVIVAIMIVWTWPALVIVHRTSSPPFSAADWVKHRNVTAYVADEMGPIFDALLADTPHVNLPAGLPPLTASMRAGDVYVREGASSAPGAIVFQRERGHLASIARSTRYFEVSIVPIRDAIQFDDGFYAPEGGGAWRWMPRHGRIILPPHLARMRVSLVVYVPLDALHAPANLTVAFNGTVIDRIHATESNIERSYDVVARTNASNEVVIETDKTVRPPADTRDLGVRINGVEWAAR
jgi:hypothetical protein